MVNVSTLTSLVFVLSFLLSADKMGRVFILAVIGPVALVGLSLAIVSDSLQTIAVHIMSANFFFSVFFTTFLVYFNEIVIDPWRRKSVGLSFLVLTLGKYGKQRV